MKTKAHTVEVYRDRTAKKEWRWRILSANGRNVANSGEGYKRKGPMLRSLKNMINGENMHIMEAGVHIDTINNMLD